MMVFEHKYTFHPFLFSASLYVKSPGCKQHFDISKCTFQYAYLVTTYLLSYYGYVVIGLGATSIFEEGDGRCVRASWPNSIKLFVLGLLLNPPSALCCMGAFVYDFKCSLRRKCSPSLPSS